MAAANYLKNGWAPIPVPRGRKGAQINHWTKYCCDPAAVETTFANMNVGVLLGDRSNGLVDVDLDCIEAQGIADVLLPATDAVFGRASTPRSHFLYVADPIPKTKQFRDFNGKMLVELRSSGCQTVFPGSVHPSGEDVVWKQVGAPLQIPADQLQQNVALLAVAAMLARHWPNKGSRQNTALAVAGGLHHAGVSGELIPPLVEAIAEAASDEEAEARRQAAKATVAKAAGGEAVTGWPSLKELTTPEVVNWILKRLGADKKPTTSEDGEANDNGSRKQPGACALVKLARLHTVQFYHDGTRGFASHLAGEGARRHLENHRLQSTEFKHFLREILWRQHEAAAGGDTVKTAVAQLESHTYFHGARRPVSVRVASHDNNVYMDLAHPEWLAVRITPQGWTVDKYDDVKFIRSPGMAQLPFPVPGGSVDLLRPFLNVSSDADWQLIIGWLLSALRPIGPFPPLVLNGEHGSCKSTASKMLRALVDPSAVPLRAEPRDTRDLVIAAENSWVVALDNVSRLQPWLSDGLCRLSTGGGFGTRRLYSDADEQLFYASRPVLINGIGDFSTRGDLVDRSISVTLPEMDAASRRSEKELWAAFNRELPRILGRLLDAVAAALANESKVSLATAPRMADLARWVTAAERHLGWAPGSFVQAFADSSDSAGQAAMDSCVITQPLLAFIRKGSRWRGTARELLLALNGMSGLDEKTKRSRQWPDTPSFLGLLLTRIAPSLRRSGYSVTSGRNGKGRWWEFERPDPPLDLTQLGKPPQSPAK